MEVNNFDLSESDFQHLLATLKSGDNALFKTIFLSHADDCIKFLKIKYNASHDDAYDAMLDTLLNFRQRLLEDKVAYGNIRFLFLQMASQHYLRMVKYKNNLVDIEPDPNVSYEIDENQYSDQQLLTLQVAWDKLNEQCKELLRLNYHVGLKLNEIAEQINKSYDSIRKQKERCKEVLINHFNNV